jgi:hypothetical protein
MLELMLIDLGDPPWIELGNKIKWLFAEKGNKKDLRM